ANPKESHLIVVNRILMYLQGAPPLGPWDHILKGDIELHFILTDILKNPIGIKSLLDAIGITAAQVYVDNQDSTHMVAASKVPMLKLGVMTEMPITTAEEKAQRRLEDAKKLLEAVKNRFGKNAATNKTLRNLLKQQYENFTALSSKMFDQTFDMLQKLRNKADLDTMSMDGLYNSLKVYEPEVKEMSTSSSNTQIMAFVSSSNNNPSNTNGVVNTAQVVNTPHGVSTANTQVNAAYSININNLSDAVICLFFASQPNSPQLIHEDLEQIYPDDMEEMDLR
nr:hypothetical protein [Tanacetum cinerariifolium]